MGNFKLTRVINKGGEMKLEKILRTAVVFGALGFMLFGKVGKLESVEAAGWVKSGSEWKYDDGNGPVKNRWMYIDGKWYYFDG